ncbi:MAG: hypothetical protein U0930_12795 [Pirellulales bacterium]
MPMLLLPEADAKIKSLEKRIKKMEQEAIVKMPGSDQRATRRWSRESAQGKAAELYGRGDLERVQQSQDRIPGCCTAQTESTSTRNHLGLASLTLSLQQHS